MIISYMQLQKTMEFFENPENTMQIVAMEKKDNVADILNAIRVHCNQREQHQIDHLLNALQMVSTYDILFNGGTE